MRMLSDKYKGCLVGAVIGDCLGAPFEKVRRPLSLSELPNFFKRLLNHSVSKKQKAGRNYHEDPGFPYNGYYQYTDDTAMTHELAKSLIEKKQFEAKDVAIKFSEEFLNNKQLAREYGPKVRVVFRTLKKKNYEDVFGPAKKQFKGTGSFGNGASMRVAPVALLFRKDKTKAIEVAREQAKLTHAHVNGYNGAILQCLAVHYVLNISSQEEFSADQFLDLLLSEVETLEFNNTTKDYCQKLKDVKELLKDDMTPENIAKRLGNDLCAPNSVPTAIYAFLRGFRPLNEFQTESPFLRTIYFAIAVGGDTDTIGTMAGSIAGAYYGLDGIPQELQNYCSSISKAIEIAEELLDISDVYKST